MKLEGSTPLSITHYVANSALGIYTLNEILEEIEPSFFFLLMRNMKNASTDDISKK